MRSKVRSVIAVIGVMGCTALLLFGLGLKDSVNFISNWMYKDLNVYESKVNLKEGAAAASVEALKNAYNGQLISEANIQIRNFDKQESGSLTVLDKGEEIKFQDAGRNSITLPDKDIGLSYKMAEILKLKAGDKVEWRIYGEKDWHKSEIRTIYRTPMGQGIVMSKEEYQKMGYEFKPTALLTPLKADGAEKLEAVKEVQDKKELMNSFNKMLDSMQMIIAILVVAAVTLGSVVLYNLGTLSFTERMRELATLKVLGFLPKQIRSLLQMQNLWLTVIGILAGIPAGCIFVGFMLTTMPDSSDMAAYVSSSSIIISICVTFTVSVLVSLVLSRKVKSIDMVASLKSVE